MFQFGRFPSYNYGFIVRSPILHRRGFPIRISADQSLFAAPRSFSQLVTSFFGSWCQGIHPVLFFAWTSFLVLLRFLINNCWVCFLSRPLLLRRVRPIVVLPFSIERPSFLQSQLSFVLLFLFIQFSKNIGGLKWIRTTDLMLIRHAL